MEPFVCHRNIHSTFFFRRSKTDLIVRSSFLLSKKDTIQVEIILRTFSIKNITNVFSRKNIWFSELLLMRWTSRNAGFPRTDGKNWTTRFIISLCSNSFHSCIGQGALRHLDNNHYLSFLWSFTQWVTILLPMVHRIQCQAITRSQWM